MHVQTNCRMIYIVTGRGTHRDLHRNRYRSTSWQVHTDATLTGWRLAATVRLNWATPGRGSWQGHTEMGCSSSRSCTPHWSPSPLQHHQSLLNQGKMVLCFSNCNWYHTSLPQPSKNKQEHWHTFIFLNVSIIRINIPTSHSGKQYLQLSTRSSVNMMELHITLLVYI